MLTINPQTKEIGIHRYTDSRHKWTLRDITGAPLDVSSATFKFTVRSVYDSAIVFQLASPAVNGIDMSNAASGVLIVTIPRAYSGAMSGLYVYDLQMTLGGNIELPAGCGTLRVHKDVTGSGSAPVVIPPLQFLVYKEFHFERQLQDGDVLTQDLNLARTSSITVRKAHLDADFGPSGGPATIALQDSPSAPTQVVNLIIPDSAGAPVHQAFDVDSNPATLTPFTLTFAAAKKLTIKVPTANLLERGTLHLGFAYA